VKQWLVVPLLAVFALCGIAQQKPIYTTALNGESWRGGEIGIKRAYVGGFLDASELHRVQLREVQKISKEASDYVEGFEKNNPDISGVKIDTIVEGVDRFYEDYRNRKIHAAYALRIVSLELTGHASAEVEAETLKLRRLSVTE
jgi:hypothetical protein